MEATDKLSVYFDGACPLCSREIDVYRGKPNSDRLRFVDISSPEFSATSEGLDAEKVDEVFHVKDASGKVITGVEAFATIWDKLEIWSPLSKFSKTTLGSSLMNAGYVVFSKLRPFLPKKDNCEVCVR